MPRFFCLCVCVIGLAFGYSAAAQEPAQNTAPADIPAQQPEAEVKQPPAKPADRAKGPSSETVQKTLTSLIKTEARLRAELADLRQAAAAAPNELERADIEASLSVQRAQIDLVTARIEQLATGVETSDYDLSKRSEFDLQSELQQLVEPFVSIMKSATEEARTIERLRRVAQTAQGQADVARRAANGVQGLLGSAQDPESRARLQELLTEWQEKERSAIDLAVSTERQLQTKLNEQDGAAESSGAAIREFLNTRGRNLLFGLLAFGTVFIVMRFAGQAMGATLRKGRRRSFGRRLFQLVYTLLKGVLSFVAMLAVFNALNDWLLFGLGILVLLAILWFGLKTLPSLVEQGTLLLNLGAVQEGERIMFNGIPFLVEKLDFYSDLVNPKLRGGHFTIPVSELAGFHSRPVAEDEVWFPCEEGNVVILEDERWGRVTFQSPEAVVMVDDGGSRHTFEAPAFLALTPRNMSDGYRTECEFGVDYKHQAIATTEIPRIMAQEVRKDIEAKFGAENVRNVAVEFISAGDSSLLYEVEADMTAAADWQWEEVTFALAQFATDSCTRNGWNIPFPHLTVTRPA